MDVFSPFGIQWTEVTFSVFKCIFDTCTLFTPKTQELIVHLSILHPCDASTSPAPGYKSRGEAWSNHQLLSSARGGNTPVGSTKVHNEASSYGKE